MNTGSDPGIHSVHSVSPNHATRDSVAKTPYFPKTIFCLALIMSESHDSGCNPGWDGNGKLATIPNEFRESSCRVSRIEIGADSGLFATWNVLPTTLASRGRVAKTPPPFLEKISCLAWIIGETG